MWRHKEEKIMVRKVNYNNPIMQEYIKKGQNINTGSKYCYSTMKGFGLVNPSHTTIIYQGFSDSSSTTSTSKSSSNEMTTAEKWAAGIQIGAAGIKAAAEIIEAIGDVKAKNPGTTSKSTVAKDNTVYETSSSSSTSKSEFKEAKKDAKTMARKITDEISNHKKTGDKTGLVDAVTTAKESYDKNTEQIEIKQKAIADAKKEYDKAKKAYDDYHKDGGEYKTAEEEVGKAQGTYDKTKKDNDKEISTLEKEYKDCETKISTLDKDIPAKEKFINEMKAKGDLTPEDSDELKKAQEELDNMKSQKQDAEKRKGEIDKKIADRKADTKAKYDELDAARAKFTEVKDRSKELNDSMELSHSESQRIKSEKNKEITDLNSLNKELKKPIKEGQEELGPYAV